MSVFTHAGVSKQDGQFKVRFANDALRVKVLAKNGHSDIDIIELKEPMSKEDAIAFLISIDFATQNGVTNAAVQAALFDAVDKRAVAPAKTAKVKAVKAVKTAKVKAVKAVKTAPTMESIKAKATKTAPKSTVSKAEIVAQMEDAPY
jgi:hypothetical protein